MKRLLSLLAVVLALVWAQPSFAAIGTPTVIATNTMSAPVASGSTIATTVDAPVGSLIVFGVFPANTNTTVSSVVLSSGDAVSLAVQPSATASVQNAAIFYVSNTAHDLPISGTITVTTSGGSWRLAAYVVSGANGGLDKTNSTVVSVGTVAASLATVGLSTSNEISFADIYHTSTVTAWTEGTGFTTLSSPNSGHPGISYDTVSTSTAIAWAPSWTGTSTFSAAIATFEATGAAGATAHNLSTLGVGQ